MTYTILGVPEWLSQFSVLIPDFCSGHDLRVVGLSPPLAPCSVWSLLVPLSLFLSASVHVHSQTKS